MRTYWCYHWLHIPTGKTGKVIEDRFSVSCISFKTLIDALAYWSNRDWVYWPDKEWERFSEKPLDKAEAVG